MWEIFLSFFHDKSGWELFAVFLGLLYLVFAMRENILCWPAAFVSTAIYTWIFWHVSLLMDSALNVYYMVMAVYGLWVWGKKDEEHVAIIHRWSAKQHTIAIGGVVVASFISGYLLKHNTQAAWPFLDSFTTWGSVLTTYMVVKKVLENWLYWAVIDSVAIVLYIERGLYPTAMLFALYLIMCGFGYCAWLKQYKKNELKYSSAHA